VAKGIKALAWFVLVGWAIYPIGYMAMPGGWLGPDGAGLLTPGSMDLIYNLGDAINKIGFGLVVYMIAIEETRKELQFKSKSAKNEEEDLVMV
jgi:bacteriorhodopsin